ncbi:hypothetical protein LTR56_021363 [Elasticomyces elasticus]|nr:hypothetical protein LTR22_026143 [Elasticomyces elasticus]KAK3623810.1 hypothetical protein LTR56_021363 [Elasticomyces elasticus]KAK4921022.1 hypothetical protein LTR49_011567 [Elasticomyces elasticus]KAK5759473.1 hypothetical protein LTS12_010330 [Elasticomyces elasticus]
MDQQQSSSSGPAQAPPPADGEAPPPRPYFVCKKCGKPRADPAYRDSTAPDRCTYCRDRLVDDDLNTEHKWCIKGAHATVRGEFFPATAPSESHDSCTIHYEEEEESTPADGGDGFFVGAAPPARPAPPLLAPPPLPAPPPPPAPAPLPAVPPPPAPVPLVPAGGRLVVNALGGRMPYTDGEVRSFFAGDNIRDAIFGQTGLVDALNLRQALHVRDQGGNALSMRNYGTLGNLTCEDLNVTFPPGSRPLRNQDFVAAPPWFEPAGTVRIPCTNQADWINPATTFLEPSICREPMISATGHIPRRHRLVCTPCKTQRTRDTTWRRRALWFPICGTCRAWANANVPLAQTDCDCAPTGDWTAGRNGNQPRTDHLCREHDRAFWNNTIDRVQAEINRRRRMTRKTKPKQIGAKKSKKATPLNSLTPRQRRDRMKHSASAWPVGTLYATPRCFCGNRTTFEDDRRPNGRLWENLVAANPVNSRQWRNCVGCREFVNTTH